LNSIDKWIFRFQYGKAYQAADDWHKYATDPGVRNYPSLDLQPEKITSYEISATFIPFGEMLVTASIFKNDIDNLISPGIDVNDNPYYTNKSKAEIIGYEISYRYNIKNTFIIDANFSGAKNEDGNGREIGDIAKIKANIGVMCRFFENSLQITPKINYVGKKLSYGRGLKPSSVEKIDDYAILGINCRYLLKGTGLEFNIKIDNLLNKKYYNPGPREADGSKYPAKVLQPGFNMLIGIRYRI
ncbi:TonB-dependent receptor, partial [Candidatus Dependentiae bacterium]|nr:TonB-dependent receptor [Candidatus Dependentiae bacterium]